MPRWLQRLSCGVSVAMDQLTIMSTNVTNTAEITACEVGIAMLRHSGFDVIAIIENEIRSGHLTTNTGTIVFFINSSSLALMFFLRLVYSTNKIIMNSNVILDTSAVSDLDLTFFEADSFTNIFQDSLSVLKVSLSDLF
jgi:hypothetical protein